MGKSFLFAYGETKNILSKKNCSKKSRKTTGFGLVGGKLVIGTREGKGHGSCMFLVFDIPRLGIPKNFPAALSC